MTYYLYHIPGKKIGVTCDLKYRVEEQQGYQEDEYEVILQTDDISLVSEAEISLQKAYGYRVDRQLYKDLYKNNFKQLNNMNISTIRYFKKVLSLETPKLYLMLDFI